MDKTGRSRVPRLLDELVGSLVCLIDANFVHFRLKDRKDTNIQPVFLFIWRVAEFRNVPCGRGPLPSKHGNKQCRKESNICIANVLWRKETYLTCLLDLKEFDEEHWTENSTEHL